MKTIRYINRTIFLFGIMLFMCLSADGQEGQHTKFEHYTFGDGVRFRNEANDYSIIMRGYIQPHYELKYFLDPKIARAYHRVRIRRARIRFSGKAAQDKVSWRLQFDLSGSNEAEGAAESFLMDAWIGYNITKHIQVRLGQKNTPTDNRELLMRSHTLQLVERSRVTSAFSSIREFGLFIDGSFKTGGGTYLRPSIAITNGDGLNVYSPDFGGLKYGGRIDFLPFGTFVNMGQYHQVDMMRELTPKLVFGVAYSVNEGMSSRRGRTSGDILYLDDKDEYSLPNYSKLGVDFIFKYKGFSAIGEFVSTTASVPTDITQRIRNDGSTSTSFPVDGEDDVENYVKGRMMLGKGYNIQMGYLFKNRWSVDARYAHLEADQYSFLNNGTFYNRPNYYTFGLTKYFSKMYGFKIQASLTYVETAEGSNDLKGNPMNGDELIFRVITSISF